MRRNLPGTLALQAFESAAFHGSVSAAARELARTQSAISRQIQALEQHLDTELFARRRQRIHLTPAGERYLEHVRAAFDRLEAGELELRAGAGFGGGVLRLGILPTYGTRWLIPRLPSFYAAHPSIQVQFTTRLSVFDFASEDLDAAIHYGEGHWPGAVVEHLMDEEVVVVCSATYRRELGLHGAEDLRRATLLQITSRPHAFADFLHAQGLEGIDSRRGPRFEHHQMALEAAKTGLGVAVLPSFAVDDELARGTIVEAIAAARSRTGKGYWFAYPERRTNSQALQVFGAWLRGEHGVTNGPARAS